MNSICIIKIGNTSVAQAIDYLFTDIAKINIISSGAKLNPKQIKEIIPQAVDSNPDLIILTTPNPEAVGPAFARSELSQLDIPVIIIGDSPLVGVKIQDEMKHQNLGFILVSGDPMIGVRQEFLDASEMCIFNADIVKVLAICGVFKTIRKIIIKYLDHTILPQLTLTGNDVIVNAGFTNPYAEAKALAAYTVCESIAYINLEGSYLTDDFERYMDLLSAASELANTAYKLADEAYMIEHTPSLHESNDFADTK